MIRLEVIGNLTRDPETRTIQKGETDGKVTNFTIAAPTGYGDFKRTEFVRVSAWNGLGKTCSEYLRKGSKVYVAGPVSVNVYINSEGRAAGNLELRLDEIEFLSAKPAVEDGTEDDVDELL